jgi:hypothetical protein
MRFIFILFIAFMTAAEYGIRGQRRGEEKRR